MHNSNDRGVLENEFAHWMQQTGIYNDRTIDSRRSNARTIEKYYGLLIDQWKKDGFASLYREVSYSKHDELIGRPNPSKIPIDGNIYNGLATYKSTLKIYDAFLSANPLHSTHFHFGEIGLKVKRALCKLTDSCKKRLGYSAREVKTDIIEPLLILLDEELGTSMQYTFSAEETPHCETGTKGNRERYDIIGQSEEDCPVIIIEVDTHRSDQVSKKVVSRIAMNADKEVLYVTLLYPNTHANKTSEKKECQKYIDFLNILFSLFSNPQKTFMYHWLFN